MEASVYVGPRDTHPSYLRVTQLLLIGYWFTRRQRSAASSDGVGLRVDLNKLLAVPSEGFRFMLHEAVGLGNELGSPT